MIKAEIVLLWGIMSAGLVATPAFGEPFDPLALLETASTQSAELSPGRQGARHLGSFEVLPIRALAAGGAIAVVTEKLVSAGIALTDSSVPDEVGKPALCVSAGRLGVDWRLLEDAPVRLSTGYMFIGTLERPRAHMGYLGAAVGMAF